MNSWSIDTDLIWEITDSSTDIDAVEENVRASTDTNFPAHSSAKYTGEITASKEVWPAERSIGWPGLRT